VDEPAFPQAFEKQNNQICQSPFMQGAANCCDSICKSKAWPNVEALFEITSLIPKKTFLALEDLKPEAMNVDD
jgi:hypothetical protein